MGYKHSHDEILTAAVDEAFAGGLSALTFARVARRAGTSDRIVVYYFPSKDELIAAGLAALGVRLQAALAAVFDEPVGSHLELVRRTWPVVARPEHDAVFAVYFEAMGLAASGREPYRTMAPAMVDAWVSWMAGFVSGSPEQRRADAEAALAVIDGLLLLRAMAGADAADRAAGRLDVAAEARHRR